MLTSFVPVNKELQRNVTQQTHKCALPKIFILVFFLVKVKHERPPRSIKSRYDHSGELSLNFILHSYPKGIHTSLVQMGSELYLFQI